MANSAEQQSASPQLPPEIVVKVLQHVTLQQRLQTCALVQRSWHKAAAAATSSIKLTCKTQSQLDSAVSWVKQHGQAVTQLSLQSSDAADAEDLRLRELPCAKLIELRLSRPEQASKQLTLHKMLTSAVPSLLSTCDSLQRLDIYYCDALVPQSRSYSNGWPYGDSRPFEALYSVPQLTSLALHGVGDTDNCQLDLKPVLSLTALKSLTLVDAGHIALWSIYKPGFSAQMSTYSRGPQSRVLSAGSAGVESSGGESSAGPGPISTWPLAGLINLHIASPTSELHIDSQGTPDVAKHTALKHLTINNCFNFGPDLLDSMTQLKSLYLDSCLLDMPDRRGVIHSKEAVQTFLRVLPKLQRLRWLEVGRECFPTYDDTSYAPAPDYAALTASSKLEVLKLPAVNMPPGAWGHVFKPGPGRSWPQLTQLVVGASATPYAAYVESPDRVRESVIEGIVSSCPNLRTHEITADEVSSQQEHFKALLQLTALTQLKVCHSHWTISIMNKATPDSPPDVVEQLRSDLALLPLGGA